MSIGKKDRLESEGQFGPGQSREKERMPLGNLKQVGHGE